MVLFPLISAPNASYLLGPNMEPMMIVGGEDRNPLIEFGRMDDWAQLSLDIRLMRSYLRAGLTPREALAAFRGELCAVALRVRAA